MATTQYIGARYVPVIYGAWVQGVQYEPLTIVTYLNQSYTSKKPVPATVGNPADNGDYWALTGAYNAQIAQLTEDVAALETSLSSTQTDVTTLRTDLTNTQTDVELLEYKNYTIRCNGTDSDATILDAWYTDHRTELNAIDFMKKRNMVMNSPYTSALRAAAIGSNVLEFYGITSMPDSMDRITFMAIKLQASGSRIFRYRCNVNLTPATWTLEDLSSTVHDNTQAFNLLVM